MTGSSVDFDAKAPSGKQLGRYTVHGVLGRGGMGCLYLATQRGVEGFTKVLALKKVLPGHASNPQLLKMFLAEGTVAARLTHPNIVQTYELSEIDGDYVIAMEFLPGEDLGVVFDRLRALGERIPVSIAAAIIIQCAHGLQYAHELSGEGGKSAGLVHRDVNPSNIVLTYHGVAKLLDFGVAKFRASSVDATQAGTFKGKLRYSAPEQINRSQSDRRTDVFALGIVLWECLTGTRLFQGDNQGALLESVLRQEIPPPSALRGEVSAELDAVVLKALQRSASNRFASANEFVDALERAAFSGAERPTQQSVGRWLEGLFGAERASLKQRIAQGQDLDVSLQILEQRSLAPIHQSLSTIAALDRPLRKAWSDELTGDIQLPPPQMPAVVREDTLSDSLTSVRLLSSETEGGPSSVRSALPVFIVAGVAVAAIAGAFVWSRGGTPPQRAPMVTVAKSTLRIVTTPPGAKVLIDGEPVGMTTPALINEPRTDRAMEVRVTMQGYRTKSVEVQPKPGQDRTLRIELEASHGWLQLNDVPKEAKIFLNDERMRNTRVLVPFGSHEVRVETDERVLFEKTVVVTSQTRALSLR